LFISDLYHVSRIMTHDTRFFNVLMCQCANEIADLLAYKTIQCR